MLLSISLLCLNNVAQTSITEKVSFHNQYIGRSSGEVRTGDTGPHLTVLFTNMRSL